MKNLFLIFISLIGCTGNGINSKKNLHPKSDISVFDFSTYSFNYRGSEFYDMKNNVKIAYYKDCVLYMLDVMNSKIEIDKDGDNVVEIDTNKKNNTKRYFVFRNSAKKGLMFSSLNRSVVFDYKEFLNSMGMNFKDYTLFNLNFGKPDKTERDSQKNLVKEKFSPIVKSSNDPDSIFCFYDKSLKGIDFSFNPEIDEKSKSKLWKIEMIFNPKSKPFLQPRHHVYWKIEKSRSFDKRTFLEYFDKFFSEESKAN